MNEILTENHISINSRYLDIVLVIDGSSNKSLKLGQNLYQEMKRRAADQSFRIYCSLLNWNQEQEPDINNIIPAEQLNKGKFITPVVENLFNRIEDKKADLVLLFENNIYDYNDWKNVIQSKFSKVIIRDTSIADSRDNLQKMYEDLLSRLFLDTLKEITIVFDSQTVPFLFPKEFDLVIDPCQGNIILKLTSSEEDPIRLPVKFEIKARGLQSRSVIKVQTDKYNFLVNRACQRFSPTRHVVPGEEEKRIIYSHLQLLIKQDEKAKKALCPLCNQHETFHLALKCLVKDQYITSFIQELFRKPNSNYLFIDQHCNLLPSQEWVLEYREGSFLFMVLELAGKRPYRVIMNQGIFKVDVLEEVFRGLYRLPDNEGFVLLKM